MDWPILMKFVTVMQLDPPDLSLSLSLTHTQPFYGCLDFVRKNPGEPVPEETFTRSHDNKNCEFYKSKMASATVLKIYKKPS